MSETFSDRLNWVRERIEAACARSGRVSDEVRILPITKGLSPQAVREAADYGLTAFGESRVQEAVQKASLCQGHLAWHLVGHLQTNKVGPAARLFRMIHSVDSERLLYAIDRAAESLGAVMPICLQVNVSGEGSKFGLAPDSASSFLRAAEKCMNVEVVGLMTIPPADREPESARPYFRRLRELRDSLRAESGFELPELSMGMSHDFEIAIEEGATWVRLGTILFGKRQDDETIKSEA